ncbi:hypothetical protein PIB30_028813 [Stylosanthes scabra]|uniref:Uncharacterized protein n=1 Tax=Stylosanthes scabra TaxID=79078 RepID=A0ABU6TAT4_9FABA|nr:hypothetical protein [Stylosanthes scabra]
MAPPDPNPKPLSDNNDDANVVFIDTTLDTHLAVLVSDHDTVSDLKGSYCFSNGDTLFYDFVTFCIT